MSRLLLSQRNVTAKLILIGGLITFLLTIYTLHPSSSKLRDSVSGIFSIKEQSRCTPEQWSSGQWTKRNPPRTHKQNATSVADVLEFEGFEGCASDREYKWHLSADNDQLGRFPTVASYEWTPSEECHARRFDRAEVIRDMVENGGWLLIGDSVSEGHFFSLSCLLYPHVRATPNYTENPYFDRAWPQNLYLNPDSPLVSSLHPPEGFNISLTPLVTFRRVDLLLTQDQLRDVHRNLHPDEAFRPDFQLFGDEPVWELLPTEYLDMLTAPLPEANYGTLVASTAGHWTVGTISGLKNTSLPGDGIQNVMEFFGEAMGVWAGMVDGYMQGSEKTTREVVQRGGGIMTKGGRRRRVLLRAYLPGHDGCHNIQEPWSWYEQGSMRLPYNWGEIPGLNKIFQNVVKQKKSDYIHFLPIDRPGQLRPDSHAGGDCLHLMSGSGVVEGWSEYIWHYVTRELEPTR